VFLDILSAQFRRRALRANIAFNPGFAGAYDFSRQPDFGVLNATVSRWASGRMASSCVNPGFVDETLSASTR